MNGILLIDKPSDWTSNDVVAKLRGVLHEKRVGHAGTLDPMATGLLVVFVGRATRAASFAEAQDKRYLASLRLGLTTDTQDITGRVLAESSALPGEEALREALRQFEGEIDQIPPMYSAIKHQGRKLYEIARRGGEVERAPRRIRIDAIRLLGREGEDWRLDVTCSKGTYVRTLCHDIGQSLGCGGCLSELRRVSAGEFSVENAHRIEDVQRAADAGNAASLLLPVDRLFSASPALTVGAEEEKTIRCGGEIDREIEDGSYRVYAEDGAFLALSRAEAGRLTTIKSFFEVG